MSSFLCCHLTALYLSVSYLFSLSESFSHSLSQVQTLPERTSNWLRHLMSGLTPGQPHRCPESLVEAFFWSSVDFFLCFFFFLIIFFICSGFCHTLKWNSHGFPCVPHPYTPSHLRLHPLPLGLPSAPGPSACLMHPTWAGYLFHPRYYTCFDAVLLKHPTLAFSHRV